MLPSTAKNEHLAEACLGPVPRGTHWARKRVGFRKLWLPPGDLTPYWLERGAEVDSGGQRAHVAEVDHVQKTVVLWYGP